MNEVFLPGEPFQLPDGTLLSVFLNSKDDLNDLPFDMMDDFSIAMGIIEPGVSSEIHLHPIVTQVTYVLEGSITIKMKDVHTAQPYENVCHKDQAMLTRPITFFQLINTSDAPCRVLYIVSPAYLFEMSDDKKTVIYNDAVILGKDWAALEAQGWQPPIDDDYEQKRIESYKRLKDKSKGDTNT